MHKLTGEGVELVINKPEKVVDIIGVQKVVSTDLSEYLKIKLLDSE